jgi:hypothetical protein
MFNRVFVNKLERERPLGKARSRRKSSDILYLKEIGWEVQDWVELAQKLCLFFFN